LAKAAAAQFMLNSSTDGRRHKAGTPVIQITQRNANAKVAEKVKLGGSGKDDEEGGRERNHDPIITRSPYVRSFPQVASPLIWI
jgi:hypothetical protein